MNIFNLFVSQPMTGYSIEEIKNTREKAVKAFIKKYNIDKNNIKVIDNLQEDHPEYTHTDYLANDIKYIGKADGILFTKGWQLARGCKVEFHVASEYGIDCYFE